MVAQNASGSGSSELARRPLNRALVISLLIHLLLAIGAFWLPFERADVRSVIEEPDLTFVFDDLEEEPLQPVLEPLPPPIRPAPEVPREEPEPLDSSSPPPPAPAPPPASASTANGGSPPPVAEAVDSRSAAPEPAQDIDLPDATSAEYFERVRRETESAGAEPGERRLDLDRALRDFRRDVSTRPRSVEQDPAGPSSASTFVPDPSSVPPTGFGVGNLVFESQDFDWNDYARQIYWAIWRAWHWRLYQTTNEFDRWAFARGRWYLDHAVRIRFVIEETGDITGIVIEGGSNCDPLDRSATDALTEVNLPPLPAAFPRDREVVHARFIAIGDIRDMRPSLSAQHRAGRFP